jgi:hypothetical protein
MLQESVDISVFVDSSGVSLPPEEEFFKVGAQTALKNKKDGSFFRSNYERGMLVYALVAHYRPTTVIGFATRRGYDLLCMAWSRCDHDIPGTIYTIDILSPDD